MCRRRRRWRRWWRRWRWRWWRRWWWWRWWRWRWRLPPRDDLVDVVVAQHHFDVDAPGAVDRRFDRRDTNALAVVAACCPQLERAFECVAAARQDDARPAVQVDRARSAVQADPALAVCPRGGQHRTVGDAQVLAGVEFDHAASALGRHPPGNVQVAVVGAQAHGVGAQLRSGGQAQAAFSRTHVDQAAEVACRRTQRGGQRAEIGSAAAVDAQFAAA
jgi:hypothetical protein